MTHAAPMTPERLAEIRAYRNGRGAFGDDLDAMIRELLADRDAQCAALDRIRAATKRSLPGWVGIDTDDGLAASVDTALEVGAGAQKSETWYRQAMTRVRDALGMRSEFTYPYNDVAIDRLVAEIARRLAVKRDEPKAE